MYTAKNDTAGRYIKIYSNMKTKKYTNNSGKDRSIYSPISFLPDGMFS